MSKAKTTTRKPRAKAPLLSSSNVDLEFKEPPEPTRSRTVFPAEALKKAKGKWAVIKTAPSKAAASSAASYLKKRLAEEGVEGFELRAAEEEVFARFVG